MGQYMSSPITDKETVEGGSDKLRYGISAQQGWRRYMEDAHIAKALDDDTYLFAVFDGHGGGEVARFCALHFSDEFMSSADYNSVDLSTALARSFHRMDELLRTPEGGAEADGLREPEPEARGGAVAAADAGGKGDGYGLLRQLLALQRGQGAAAAAAAAAGANGPAGRPPAGAQAGCTAVAVVVRRGRIVVANAGDSRAVLARSGRAVALSEDHKPARAAERERIVAAGGYVSDIGGVTRVNGNLNLSRAIGDLRYKGNGRLPPDSQIITAEPDVVTELIEFGDRFIIVACDGIWDVMNNQQAVDFISRRLDAGDSATQAASALLDACISRDPKETRGIGCDNMTAGVVLLRPTEEPCASAVTATALDATATEGDATIPALAEAAAEADRIAEAARAEAATRAALPADAPAEGALDAPAEGETRAADALPPVSRPEEASSAEDTRAAPRAVVFGGGALD